MTGLVLDGVSVTGPQGAIVQPCTLTLRPGVPLAMLGETGSGKSLLMQAVMGTLPAGLLAEGSARLGGTDLLRLDAPARRALWGRRVALLPQEPWVALDPVMRAPGQVAEVPRYVQRRPWPQARALAMEAMAALGLARGERRFPFQLSGGMCQRVALAAMRLAGAEVLLADEPTKGLDIALRDGVVALLRAEAAAGRMVMVITHDVAVARDLGGDVAVLLDGAVVDSGPAEETLAAPRHDYTRRLLAAEPAAWQAWPQRAPGATLIEARGIAKRFGRQRLFAGIDVSLAEAGCVALSGPSGSGKSSLGNILLGLLPPDAGTVHRAAGLAVPRVQKLYQDPVAAFAPRRTLAEAIDAVVARHRIDAALPGRWMAALRLAPALLARRPDQVSGGEVQRFALLRALLPAPRVIFDDAPTLRLDPLTQEGVMAALRSVVEETRAPLLLVTHDPVMAGKRRRLGSAQPEGGAAAGQ